MVELLHRLDASSAVGLIKTGEIAKITLDKNLVSRLTLHLLKNELNKIAENKPNTTPSSCDAITTGIAKLRPAKTKSYKFNI